MAKGDTWNESESYHDPLTLRPVRRITSQGLYNQTPTYHTNVCFSADGSYLVFASARAGKSAVYRCHVATGDITQLIEAVDGVGNYGMLSKQTGTVLGNGLGIDGLMCLAPRSLWLVYLAGRSLRAVHLETLEERMLIEDYGANWVAGIPSIDPEEKEVLLPLMSAHPAVLAGQRLQQSYMEAFADGSGMSLNIVRVALSGGEVSTIYHEAGVGSAHCPHSPIDCDLLLLDRDFPPSYWARSDGQTNRIWTLRRSTAELLELPSQDDACFQVHSVWSYDGAYILYHGPSAKRGHYIGVMKPNGDVVREYAFHDAPHYGHVGAMAGRPAIILDGNLSRDMLLWLYYDEAQPRVEVIARHGTDWAALPGQYPHPHPHSDPTGQWISFNAAQRGRSDVFVVAV